MSDIQDRIQNEVDELRSLRDELKLKVHLGKMDAQERFEKAEKDWEHLEAKLKVLADAGRESAEDVGQAARLLVDEIRAGYRHVRELL
jgi:hypothetical protein